MSLALAFFLLTFLKSRQLTKLEISLSFLKMPTTVTVFILYISIINIVLKGCSSVKIAYSFFVLDMSLAIKERSDLPVITSQSQRTSKCKDRRKNKMVLS